MEISTGLKVRPYEQNIQQNIMIKTFKKGNERIINIPLATKKREI